MMHVVGVYHDGRVARLAVSTEGELKKQRQSLQDSGASVSVIPDDVGNSSASNSAIESFRSSFQQQITQLASGLEAANALIASQGAEIARLKNPSTV